MRLILASQSSSRRAMLSAAGVPFDAMAPAVDEEAAKAALKQDGVEARGLADALAELKSLKLSTRHPADLILGCDQVLVLADDSMLDKPKDRDEAGAQLMQMRGSVIRLISAAVISEGGTPVWRHVDVASLTMRPFSDRFLSIYLDSEWPAISGCVGCFRLEGLGIQLFSRIQGNHFTILGLPLMPLLDYLRTRGVVAS